MIDLYIQLKDSDIIFACLSEKLSFNIMIKNLNKYLPTLMTNFIKAESFQTRKELASSSNTASNSSKKLTTFETRIRVCLR